MLRLLIPVFVLSIFAWTPMTAHSAVLHVITAVDAVQSDAAVEIRKSTTGLLLTLMASMPENSLSVTNLGLEKQLTKAAMVNQIRELKVAPEDAVLFYYIGHGYFDPRKQATCLKLSGDPMAEISWRDISQELAKKKVRLRVVVLDCCDREDAPHVEPVAVSEPVVQALTITPLCDRLFFQCAGSVALISSSPNEVALVKALTDPMSEQKIPAGAIFTNAFAHAISKSGDQPLSWSQFTEVVQRQTDQYFHGIAGPEKVFSLSGKQVRQQRQTARLVIDDRLVEFSNSMECPRD